MSESISQAASFGERIRRRLAEAFDPIALDVVDDSAKHKGHGGAREGGETHFSVHVVSAAFSGKSRLERHRLVNAALAQELAERVHALAIRAQAPDDPA